MLAADHLWNTNVMEADLERFRQQDVELLLDEAADLLEQILKDKAEFDALGEKQFEIDSLHAEAAAFGENSMLCWRRLWLLPTQSVMNRSL